MFLSTLAMISVLTQTPGSAAQPSARGDVYTGYNAVMSVRNQGTTTTYKGGWHGGASYRITRVISVAGEASGDYRSDGGQTANIYLYVGGVRFQSGRSAQRVRPFAELLFGGGQDNSGPTAQRVPEGQNGSADSGKINHYPVLKPGGGVDLGISPRVAVRVRVDVPLLMTTGHRLSGQTDARHTLKGTRLSIGVSIPYGTR